jgi:hypothetical protein
MPKVKCSYCNGTGQRDCTHSGETDLSKCKQCFENGKTAM